MDHPAAHQIPGRDLEKSAGTLDVASKDSTEDSSQNFAPPAQLHVPPTLSKWNARIESLAGLEARGITRVLPHERHAISLLGYTQMALLWFSANLSANNLGIAMLGPLYFQLSFLDSAMCAVFGAFVGSLATSYMSIWGPRSGNRTMVRMLLGQANRSLTLIPDCCSILYGVLAREIGLFAQHNPHGRLWRHRLHYRRPNLVSRQWR